MKRVFNHGVIDEYDSLTDSEKKEVDRLGTERFNESEQLALKHYRRKEISKDEFDRLESESLKKYENAIKKIGNK